MKQWGLGTYHNEFVFRYNRRFYRHASFETMLGLAANHKPASYWAQIPLIGLMPKGGPDKAGPFVCTTFGLSRGPGINRFLSGCRRHRYDIRLIAAQSRQVDRNWREQQITGASAPERRAYCGVDTHKYCNARRENASRTVDCPEPRCRARIDCIYDFHSRRESETHQHAGRNNCCERNCGADEKTSRRELVDQKREPIGQENEIKPERTGPKLESHALQQRKTVRTQAAEPGRYDNSEEPNSHPVDRMTQIDGNPLNETDLDEHEAEAY